MMTTKEELIRRAGQYAQRNGLTLREQLGSGIHGIVFVAESQTRPGASAIKVHEGGASKTVRSQAEPWNESLPQSLDTS